MPRFTNRVYKRRKQVGKPKIVYVGNDDVPRPTLEPSSGPSSSSRPTTQNIPKESTSSRKVSGSLVE